MREHPLPQDITNYQFHIVGNMTIKQFAEIGFGCFIGFLIYTTNLIDLIKWPLIGLSVALGAGAAFVPFEERPLDHWIITFFRVIYNPTKFYWKRMPKIPDAFKYTPTKKVVVEEELDLSPARRQKIKEFMHSIQRPDKLDQYEAYEQQRISSIMGTFDTIKIKATSIDIEENFAKPSLKVRVRELKATQQKQKSNHQPQLIDNQRDHKNIDSSQIAQDINIPQLQDVTITPPEEKRAQEDIDITPTNTSQYVENTQTTRDITSTKQASYNTDLPFPSMPTEPNKPVGMVVGPNNEILSNSIVEIINQAGEVVRAVKTNTLGQFFVTTPLGNGVYVLSTDKEGYAFDNLQVQLAGEILPPLEIRAASKTA